MDIKFIDISPLEVKACFPYFYDPQRVFFEIFKESKTIALYAIKDISEGICEISLYVHEDSRREITKKVVLECLSFPFRLGFKKIMISTDLKSVETLLKKMEKIGVKYLFEHENMHWFEVNHGLY